MAEIITPQSMATGATVVSISNLGLAIEISSSFGMLILTIGALIYIIKSEHRVQSWTNILIFLTLIVAFSF